MYLYVTMYCLVIVYIILLHAEADCTTPNPPSNGRFLNTAPGYYTGQRLRYDCNPGYKISGALFIVCGFTGAWTGGAQCSPSDTTGSDDTTCPPVDPTAGQSTQEGEENLNALCVFEVYHQKGQLATGAGIG